MSHLQTTITIISRDNSLHTVFAKYSDESWETVVKRITDRLATWIDENG